MNKLNININKTIDLLNNDGLSVCNGQSAQQHHNAFTTFHDFLLAFKPKRILEIGTALGGFTAFLGMVKQFYNLDIDILSYDIHKHPWYDHLFTYGINLKTENIFNNNYDILINQSIISYIQNDGLTVVLCDGGCKRCEFNILSPYLKNNDIIMTHDYAPTKEYHETHMYQKIWNWNEINDLDIEESILLHSLMHHPWYDEFLSVAWGCFQRSL